MFVLIYVPECVSVVAAAVVVAMCHCFFFNGIDVLVVCSMLLKYSLSL